MSKKSKDEREKKRRIKQFGEAARAIGQAVEQSGLSEAEIMAQLEEAKAQVYREYYGRTGNK